MKSQKALTLLAVSLGTFMLLLDVTIVVVALPNIQISLGASFADVQWTIDAYSLSLAAFLLPAGSLADLYGRRKLFAIGLATFTLGSLLCGLAPSAAVLIACRAAQGLGGAIVFSTSLALLAQTFEGKERGVAFGIWGAVTGVSTALGPILGGVLTSGIGWRWIFLVNLPIGIAAIAITLRSVEESRAPRGRRLDPLGFAVFTIALLALIYGLIRANESGWGSTMVVACLATAGVMLVAFPLIEMRKTDPMFDLTLFRKPTFVGGAVAAFGMNGSLFAMFIFLVIYLQRFLHFGPLETGLRLLVVTGATLVTAIPAGRLSAHVPVRLLIGPGLLLVGIGLLLMRGVTPTTEWTHLVPGFIVAGIGSGLVNPALASTAVGVVAPPSAGMASGINNTFRQIGIATSVAALGSLFATRLHAANHASYASTFTSAIDELLLVAAVLALVTGVLAFALIRQRDFVTRGERMPAME